MSSQNNIFDNLFFQISNKTSSTRKCRKLNLNGFYPSFKPVLSSLSVTNSPSGAYSLVHAYGENFLPYGTTFVKFGGIGYIPVTYYSSNNISFVVPLNANKGNHSVFVVNLYNGNYSPQVNQSYAGILNFSSPITYTIT